MKAFNKLIVFVCILAVCIVAGVNICFTKITVPEGRQYRVDASRAAAVIEQNGMESLVLSDYPSLAAVVAIDGSEGITGGQNDYLIKEINGRLYRFDYTASSGIEHEYLILMNIALGAMFVLVASVLFYLRYRIIKPFLLLRDMPAELSKGNLTTPLNENRQRYFGRFLWGMDMLREKLEQNRQKELELQAERKKLILSLSHDIKIPLSAIKLYSKSISKGLYTGEEKQAEIAEKITLKADEIEHYVSEIVTASREDFLSLDVKDGQFYLSEVIKRISEYYTAKLKLLRTDFCISEYNDCIINGDVDRAVEVIQNIIENAIKYGDGKSIAISVTEEDGCRLVSVTNTGCTLPQSELPHMFDSFWRGSNADKEKGSGLGLYICRRLINKMGGEVFAEMKDGNMTVTAVFCPS